MNPMLTGRKCCLVAQFFLILCLFVAPMNSDAVEFAFQDNETWGPVKGMKIPFGETVIFGGNLRPGTQTARLRVRTGASDHTYDLQISGSRWEQIVGPFAPNTRLLLTFEYQRNIDTAKKTELARSLADSLKKSIVDNLDAFRHTTAAEWDSLVLTEVKSQAKDLFEDYWIDKDTPLVDALGSHADSISEQMEKIYNLTFDKNKAVLKFPDVAEDVRNMESEKADIYEITGESAPDVGNLDFIIANPETSAANPKLRDWLMEECKNDTSVNCELLRKLFEMGPLGREDLDKKVTETTEDLLSRIAPAIKGKPVSLSTSVSTSAEVLDIENFISFDVAAVFLTESETVRPVFLAHPQLFCKAPQNKDPEKFFEIVTPSFGIAYSGGNIENEGPIYFAGIGAKFNRLARAGVLYAFYRKKECKSMSGEIGISVSIDFRKMGELFKIFAASASTVSEGGGS